MKKRTRGNPMPLIIEEHPANYDGYPFITLIQYRDEHFLSVVDNADDKTINAFILDWCGPEGIDEDTFVRLVSGWWENSRERFPISFEFSRLGITQSTSRIYKTFNIEFVTRVIGPLPKFDMSETSSVKRRKRKAVPEGMEVHSNVHQLRPNS
jgi:hypothetical protein